MKCATCGLHLDEQSHDDFCPQCKIFLRMCLACGTISVIPKGKHIGEIIPD